MQAIWAGGTEMLQRAVEYVLADPDASVPATAGVSWAARKQVAMLGGQVTAAAAVDLHGNGPLALFIASEAGDGLLEFDPAGEKLRNLTAGAKLKSKSRVAAWGHFFGSRRLDLASSNGKTITLWRQDEQVHSRPGRLRSPCRMAASVLRPWMSELPADRGCSSAHLPRRWS